MKNHIKMGGKGVSGVYVSSRGLQQLPTSILKGKREGEKGEKVNNRTYQSNRSVTYLPTLNSATRKVSFEGPPRSRHEKPSENQF